MSTLMLNSTLQYLKGVGPHKAAALEEFGIKQVRDLLYYLPRSYLDRTNVAQISDIKIDEAVTIIGEVKAHGILHGRPKRYEVILQDKSGAVTLLWFGGVQFWAKLFKKGQIFAASGTVKFYNGIQLVHPARMIHAGRIIPVYPQTAELNKAGLNSRQIRTLTTSLFDNLGEQIPDPLPDTIIGSSQLTPLHQAIRMLHYPESREEIETGRRRLAFDELLSLQFMVYRNKAKKDSTIKGHSFALPESRLSTFKEKLPFELTSDQKQCLTELFDDLQKPQPMSRMLHGEVGSGKTVVAIFAALYAAENSLQTAFMAPTEILAEQHFRNWQQLLEEVGIKSELLTSSLKAARKKEVSEKTASGEIDILFGTHALIYDYVEFKKLGLVIIDEQHRFGVEQRGKLYAKGNNPDLLVMTATPIPRTLALTIYGDLDISTIKSLPPGRQPIRTVWRTEDAAEGVYKFVKDEVAKGGQAYIVFPLIEHSDQNVEEAFEELSKGALRSVRLGLVHGRIKPLERDKILKQFRDGEVDVLLCTTVIEVGIDNPNATMLIIEHAERFGLAQLHQLRGRVGRGSKKSTVVGLAYSPISDMAHKRLEFFAGNSDGFLIAEADLELRGPGEMFGLRQSGLPELKVANISRDRDLLETTRELVRRLFAEKETEKLDSGSDKLYKFLEQTAMNRSDNLGGG